ncbi:MAG: hypothetical protein IIZ60_02940 [Clostridia bacterium]|nr:hypothetical protein [Clostridia bacterium]
MVAEEAGVADSTPILQKTHQKKGFSQFCYEEKGSNEGVLGVYVIKKINRSRFPTKEHHFPGLFFIKQFGNELSLMKSALRKG